MVSKLERQVKQAASEVLKAIAAKEFTQRELDPAGRGANVARLKKGKSSPEKILEMHGRLGELRRARKALEAAKREAKPVRVKTPGRPKEKKTESMLRMEMGGRLISRINDIMEDIERFEEKFGSSVDELFRLVQLTRDSNTEHLKWLKNHQERITQLEGQFRDYKILIDPEEIHERQKRIFDRLEVLEDDMKGIVQTRARTIGKGPGVDDILDLQRKIDALEKRIELQQKRIEAEISFRPARESGLLHPDRPALEERIRSVLGWTPQLKKGKYYAAKKVRGKVYWVYVGDDWANAELKIRKWITKKEKEIPSLKGLL